MTPADLRAVAARVMAGEATNEEIALAFGWMKKDVHRSFYWQPPKDDPDHHSWSSRVPDFLHSLDAADQLMRPFGFNVAVTIEQYLNANWIALAYLLHANGDCERVEAIAPTEPRARTALALLCLAVEMEGETA